MRRALTVTTTLALALTGAVALPLPGGGCTGICSETVNASGQPLTAGRNYCAGGQSTGGLTTRRPGCASEQSEQRWTTLPPGRQTPPGQDWDTFRVDPGRCYRVSFEGFFPWTPDFERSYSAAEPLYVKVGNDYTARVESQLPGPC
ncbi:hypothetical protein ACIRBX_10785 [Kitasatospora sp. NPDC096147]|uniref:hypothetical protein n=1 Tax=Kitasatospora sp. NPDC096147 TaxID=3364093 RepID=UPI0037F8F4E4